MGLTAADGDTADPDVTNTDSMTLYLNIGKPIYMQKKIIPYI